MYNQIIVVDDSSTDGTLKLASDYQKRLPDGKFRIVSLNMNQGKGGAVKIGVNFSLGKYILMVLIVVPIPMMNLTIIFLFRRMLMERRT